LQLIEKLQNIRTYEEETMSIAEKIEQLGLEKGLQQGREESRLNIAKNMLTKRFNFALIKEITGLSDQDLLNLEG
jgi:recombination-promoting nuclease RpnB